MDGRSPPPRHLLSVDTGGTFTDFLLLRDGRLETLKIPSTPDDPARAVLEGVRRLLPEPEPGPFVLAHGSTVATNTLLERTGARVALVTNRGFEDVLEIGRQDRPQLYALVGHRPPPLVPAERRIGVGGRIGPAGEELEPLDPVELRALTGRIAGAEGDAGVEAVAVVLLHSYRAAGHEEAVGRALEPLGVPVTLSSGVLPEYREYERTSTTVVNAYVGTRVDRYLRRIEDGSGAAEVRIMDSAGGTIPVARARREAVRTVLSGPAGGAVGAAAWGRRTGHERVLGFDMGGTSTDVSVSTGRPHRTREASVGGHPVGIPVLDIHTVGAGGGSVARMDGAGALRVGPESAGAVPGPICYGRGGVRVTVTDAHVWLGRLPADAFLGEGGALDRDAIREPLEALARSMGLGPEEAALGVLEVAETSMERALRVVSVERGYDPRDFALVSFGGAGGLHAASLAARLGCPRVVVPPHPGLLSAWGILASGPSREAVRTILRPGDGADSAGSMDGADSTGPEDGAASTGPDAADRAVGRALAELEASVRGGLEAEGVPAGEVEVERGVDARYRGQSYEIPVPADGWREAFHRAHLERYGFCRSDAPVEAVTVRVVARGPAPAIALAPVEAAEGEPPTDRARLHLPEGPTHVARISRDDLRGGHRLRGPLIVTEYSATTWVPHGWSLEVGPGGALVLEPSGEDREGTERG